MNTIIDNLIKKPPPQRSYCVVIKPLSGNKYQVRDSAKRKTVVESEKKWRAGSGVIVSQGLIVSAAAKFKKPKNYEV